MSTPEINLVKIIQDGGAIAVLILIVVLFIRGDLITKKAMEKILESFLAQMTSALQKAITDALTTARVKWQEEALDYARETNKKLESLPCVTKSGQVEGASRPNRKRSGQAEKTGTVE